MSNSSWRGSGTEPNLISRSKVGQMPRMLMKVNYNEQNYHIGDLEGMVRLESEKRDEELRDFQDYILDVTSLIDTLGANKDKIKSIDLSLDQRLKIVVEGSPIDLAEKLEKAGLQVKKVSY